MTEQEQNATLGCLLRQYKETRNDIACLSSGIRDAAQALAAIDEKLYRPDDEGELQSCLGQPSFDAVGQAERRLGELQRALRRKQDLRVRLDNLGYRDLIRP